ncbi:hypothetical protein SDJN03_10237, partial [Cucurbita argyrosperma subsp. sororia]
MSSLPPGQRYFSLPRPTPTSASSQIPPPAVAAAAPIPKPAKSSHHQLSKAMNIRGESVGVVMRINESCEGMEIMKNMKKKKGSEGNYDDGKKKIMIMAMNGNFQGVNNSLLFNSSFTQGDAGLHFMISKHISI